VNRVARWSTLVLVVLTGCATTKVAYEKPGATDAERKRDTAACAEGAIGHEPGRHVITPIVIDREAFAKCLEGRGYVRVR
jgi:hypothetical protein